MSRTQKRIASPQGKQTQKANVMSLQEYKNKRAEAAEERIERTLNGIVHVLGCGKVRVRDLFCPYSRSAVVVIRQKDGSYRIPHTVYVSLRKLFK